MACRHSPCQGNGSMHRREPTCWLPAHGTCQVRRRQTRPPAERTPHGRHHVRPARPSQYPGAERPSVNALNLDIADGEFLVLVGPSGCGKSTSLRMLAGLEDVTEGRIRIGDRDVTHLAPKDRDIAMVFQNYALYPHMTVADNMGFALKISGMNKDEMRKRVEEAAKILDLDPVPRPQAEGALRWSAPARRHGPGDRPQPAGVPDGRAAVQPRRQAARADPHRDRRAAAPARRRPPSTSPTTRSRP